MTRAPSHPTRPWCSLVLHWTPGRCLPIEGHEITIPPLPQAGRHAVASAVVPLGLIQLCPLQVWIKGLELDSRRHKRKRVRVSRQNLLTLRQWRSRANLTMGVPLGVIPSCREVVVTDAFASGWGVVWRHRKVRGLWSRFSHKPEGVPDPPSFCN